MDSSVACCLPAHTDSKLLLSENWIAKAAEVAEAAAAAGSAPPPAFNPADPQYNELERRLSKSSAMHKVHDLQRAVAQQEKQLQTLAGDAKEAKKAELEELHQQLTDAQAALAELQASFEQDPLALAPWMNAMFALADSGCTVFDAGGSISLAYPPSRTPLLELLAPPCTAAGGPAGVSAWLYRGAERVLGTFKRRYDMERGQGHVKLATRLALSPFGGSTHAELTAAAEAGVEASLAALQGPEGAAAGGLLDILLLHWLDYEDLESFVAVLLALKRYLAPPGYDPQQPQEVVLEGVTPKLSALGLVQPTAAALTAAVRAGMPLACVSLEYNLLDTSAEPIIALCRKHGIRVFAAAPAAYGLINGAFLGVAAPDSAAAGGSHSSSGVDNLAAGMDMVARYGGWLRLQELLVALKAIADMHSTSLQCVALAWLLQQGLTPLLPAHWAGEGPSAGTPWAGSLGLMHFKLDLPPAVGPAAGGGGDGVDAEAPAAGTEAAAADAQEAAAAQTGEACSDGSAEKPEAGSTAAVTAVQEVKGGSTRSWMQQLAGLLTKQDVEALKLLAGGPVSSVAA